MNRINLNSTNLNKTSLNISPTDRTCYACATCLGCLIIVPLVGGVLAIGVGSSLTAGRTGS